MDLEPFDPEAYYGRSKPRKKKLKLHKALKIGYTRDLNKQQKMLKKYGYVIDKDLTNPREQVIAYNPFDRKLLFIENGTDPNSEKDLVTDLLLAQGGIKQSARYIDSKNALTKAVNKYKDVKPNNVNIVGHSLGGNLTNYLAPSGSNAITYNAAFTPGQKVRDNVHNYVTKDDIVSSYYTKPNTTVLPNTHQKEAVGLKDYLLKSHEVDNVKDLPVYF
jgi:hypothetical protein